MSNCYKFLFFFCNKMGKKNDFLIVYNDFCLFVFLKKIRELRVGLLVECFFNGWNQSEELELELEPNES